MAYGWQPAIHGLFTVVHLGQRDPVTSVNAGRPESNAGCTSAKRPAAVLLALDASSGTCGSWASGSNASRRAEPLPAVVGLQLPAHDVVGEVERRAPGRATHGAWGGRSAPAPRPAGRGCAASGRPTRSGASARRTRRRRRIAVAEPVDPAVLEVAAEDAAHADVLGQPGHAGPHRSRCRGRRRSIRYPGRARLVQRLDDHRRSAIELHLNVMRPSAPYDASCSIRSSSWRLQVARRDQQRAVLLAAAVPGEVVEQLGDVGADVVVAREEPEILVEPGGLASCSCRCRCGSSGAAGRRRRARRARPCECVFRPTMPYTTCTPARSSCSRPLHVGRLVEAGLELDQHRHLHAALGGPDEAADDRAVAAGAVQRHLDRLHAAGRRRPAR